jgi:two-component system sensor histidine kinase PhoQ
MNPSPSSQQSTIKSTIKSTVKSSLRRRIVLSALLVVVVVLPSIGIALNNAFKAQVEENLQAQLNAYFYSVLAVTEFEDKALFMPSALLENQFNVINSGLYALISDANDTKVTSQSGDEGASDPMWFSDSFLGASLSSELPRPEVGVGRFGQIKVNDETHFIYSFTVRFDIGASANESPSITLHIIKDLASVTQQQQAFSQQLWTWLIVLIVVLLLIQGFWLVWILKPLSRFTQELNQVQNGQTQSLSTHYPKELASVASQLNSLLITEQKQRKRYRNALSDLAHSLKTPLAVMQSQQDLSQDSLEQLTQINRTIQHQLTRAQSAGNNAWHLGIEVKPVVDKMVRTLTKIHADKDIHIKNDENALIFRGDESDLLEILGNLLDNACKAANQQVLLSITQTKDNLVIDIEDDGQGVSDQQQAQIMQRGKRADTYSAGHGIGLAIVQDLVTTYEGELLIGHSLALNGAKFTVKFPKN